MLYDRSTSLTNVTVLSLLVLLLLLSCSGKKEREVEGQRPVPTSELPALPDTLLVLAGEQLFKSPALGTVGKSCASCHGEGEDLQGAAEEYPKFSDLAGREITLIEMNNICIERALKGKPLDPGSDGAQALTAYVRSLK
jgi:mono/diheme cytochrome c family protein